MEGLGLGCVVPLGTLCVLRLDFTNVRLEVSGILRTSECGYEQESRKGWQARAGG